MSLILHIEENIQTIVLEKVDNNTALNNLDSKKSLALDILRNIGLSAAVIALSKIYPKLTPAVGILLSPPIIEALRLSISETATYTRFQQEANKHIYRLAKSDRFYDLELSKIKDEFEKGLKHDSEKAISELISKEVALVVTGYIRASHPDKFDSSEIKELSNIKTYFINNKHLKFSSFDRFKTGMSSLVSNFDLSLSSPVTRINSIWTPVFNAIYVLQDMFRVYVEFIKQNKSLKIEEKSNAELSNYLKKTNS